MRIDSGSNVPIYQQIVSEMQSKIAAGVYREGDRIPSARDLAKKLIVNPNTIQKAYSELNELGVIETRRGLGNFVSTKATSSAIRQSEKAVSALFQQAIRVGTSASLTQKQLRMLFNAALRSETSMRTTG